MSQPPESPSREKLRTKQCDIGSLLGGSSPAVPDEDDNEDLFKESADVLDVSLTYDQVEAKTKETSTENDDVSTHAEIINQDDSLGVRVEYVSTDCDATELTEPQDLDAAVEEGIKQILNNLIRSSSTVDELNVDNFKPSMISSQTEIATENDASDFEVEDRPAKVELKSDDFSQLELECENKEPLPGLDKIETAQVIDEPLAAAEEKEEKEEEEKSQTDVEEKFALVEETEPKPDTVEEAEIDISNLKLDLSESIGNDTASSDKLKEVLTEIEKHIDDQVDEEVKLILNQRPTHLPIITDQEQAWVIIKVLIF